MEETKFSAGTLHTTYGDRLRITGPEAVPEELRAAIREHRNEIMAAVCVKNPPIPWMWTMVSRYLGEGSYRVTLRQLAAHVAAFIGLHPAHDGPRLAPIIAEALRGDRGANGGAA